MTSLLHLKAANSTGPIRPSQRQDIPRMHFTGVNTPILAQQPMAVQELCSRSRRALDQVTQRRHEQPTCSNKERTEDTTGPVRPIYHHNQAPFLSEHSTGTISTDSCDCITLWGWWWVPTCNRTPKGLAVIVAPLTDSYVLKTERHHPWAKSTVTENEILFFPLTHSFVTLTNTLVEMGVKRLCGVFWLNASKYKTKASSGSAFLC